MTCLDLLYKTSCGQINIDVNGYLQPHSEVKLEGVIVLNIGKIWRQRKFIFIPFSQGP